MKIYGKGPGKWHLVIHHRGKRLDRIVTGTKGDAQTFGARLLRDLEAGSPLEMRVVPTLRDFTGERGPYLAHTEKILATRTASNRGYQIASLVEHLGELRLNEIDRAAVSAYQSARLRAGIRPATINDDVKVLTAVLNFARDERGIPVPPARFPPLKVRGKRRNAEPWSRDEVGRLLASCADRDKELLPVLVFLLNTGCRRGEALALEWRNVDLRRGIVRIWASEEWQPKDGDDREVPINAVLRTWLERLELGRRGRWVFPSRRRAERGGKETADLMRFAYWPQRRFDEVRAAAKLTGGPHRCRHTYASHFLEACPDLFLLGRIMGHTHAHVTELYGHLLKDSLGRAAEAVSFAPAVGPAELEARKRWRTR